MVFPFSVQCFEIKSEDRIGRRETINNARHNERHIGIYSLESRKQRRKLQTDKIHGCCCYPRHVRPPLLALRGYPPCGSGKILQVRQSASHVCTDSPRRGTENETKTGVYLSVSSLPCQAHGNGRFFQKGCSEKQQTTQSFQNNKKKLLLVFLRRVVRALLRTGMSSYPRRRKTTTPC